MARRTLPSILLWSKQAARVYLGYARHISILLVFLVSLVGVPTTGVRSVSTITFSDTPHISEATEDTITYVGDIGSVVSKTSGTSLVINTTAPVSAGDDIIIAYATDPNQNIPPISVTDAAGNIYNEVGLALNSGQLRTYLFAAYDVIALPAGSNITIAANVAVAARAAVASVFRGLADEQPLDQTQTGYGSSAAPSSGTTSTTTQADELLIGGIGTEGPDDDAAGTWENSFTAGPRLGTTGGTADTNITISLGYRIVSESGEYTAAKSGITSRDWAAIITTFRAGPDVPTPRITITGDPLSDFSSLPGTPSAEQAYTVSGTELTDDITITAPGDFQISLTSGSGFGSSLTLTQTAGVVAATTIYVRFNRATEGTSSGNLVHASTGATTRNVAVSGTAAPLAPVSFNILLGRPTNHSITANIIPDQDVEFYIEYGVSSGIYLNQIGPFTVIADEPVEVVISGLAANAENFYHIVYRQSGTAEWNESTEYSFRTQRAQGSTFTFTIISDSHLGQYGGQTADELALYERTILNVSADQPDFHIDLGDTFAMDPSPLGTGMTEAEAEAAYLVERPFMGLIGNQIPIYLALGNHENEEGWNFDDVFTPPDQSLAKVGMKYRKMYYPNPVPDDFYTGNEDPLPEAIGGDTNHEDYYAWEWGDALFVVIDPYHYSMIWPSEGNSYGGEGMDGEPEGDRWDWTLGIEQYLWLKETLENSAATYKFVFTHHVTGGATPYGRGGISAAPYFEWGGNNADGTWGWDTERPASEGWDVPIHQLMVENGVNVFFHGHDHIYAEEELDGIVYLECPKPDDAGYDWEPYGYGYTEDLYPDGLMIQNSGHIRVTVSPEETTIDYVRAYLPGDGSNGEVANSITVVPASSTNHRLTLAVDPEGTGTTTPAIGAHIYPEDETVNVTAAPAAGYVFDQWSGDCSGSGACQVTMDDDKSVTAHFVTAPNQPPVVSGIPDQTIAEGESFTTINLDNYVSDVDNTDAEMTWSASGNTDLGVSITNRVATISMPNADWNGSETITFRATDPGTLYDEDAATFTVTAINDAPVVSDIPDQTIAEGTSFTSINLDDYVSDVDNTDAEMTWSASGNTALGVSITNRVATISVPNADWNGSETITFRATDPGALYDEDTATFTVTPVNDAPVAEDDTYTAVEDTTLNVPAPGVLGNDSDIDGDPMTAVKLSDPSHGTLALNSDGSFSYTPAALYNGSDSFTYQANDGTLGSNTATVHINVGAVNNAPVCTAASLTTAEDTSGEVVPACTDADGDTLNYSIVTQPSHGAVAVVAGMLSYMPASNYNGADSFTYKANDGPLDSNAAAVSVTVTPVNDAPVLAAIGDQAINELVQLSFSAQATDIDGDVLSFSLDSGAPVGATIQPASGLFTWTPTEAQGPGSYPVTIRVSDGLANDFETITITVSEVNLAPVASDDSYTTKQDTLLSVPVGTGVLANDSDGDGNAITAVLINLPNKGFLSFNSDGSFMYTPEVGFFGSVIFTYRAYDGQFYSENAQVRIDITPAGKLFLPIVQNGS